MKEIRNMEEVKRLYEDGKITKSVYFDYATESTLSVLERDDSKIIRTLGEGNFRIVKEIRRPGAEESYATKIVLTGDATEFEKELWCDQGHPNVLRLLYKVIHVASHTISFHTVVHPDTLKNLLHSFKFQMDSKAFERSVSYINGVIEGLKYLHEQNLCLMSLEIENILISRRDHAVICGLSTVTSNENGTTKYGVSKWIYRPPEAKPRVDVRKPVDGQLFDIWSLGIVALELFTRESYLEKSLEWEDLSFDYWTKYTYPAIFDIVQRKEFRKLMRRTYPISSPGMESVENALSLVLTCLNMNPVMRPSAKKLLGQKLFGGRLFCTIENTDVWNEKASSFDLEVLMNMFEVMELNRNPNMCDAEILPVEQIEEGMPKDRRSGFENLKKKVNAIKGIFIEKRKNACEAAIKEVSGDTEALTNGQVNEVMPKKLRDNFANVPNDLKNKVNVIKEMFLHKPEKGSGDISQELSGGTEILPNEKINKNVPENAKHTFTDVPKRLKKTVDAFKGMFVNKPETVYGETSEVKHGDAKTNEKVSESKSFKAGFPKVPRKLKEKVNTIKGVFIEKPKDICKESSKEIIGDADISANEQINNHVPNNPKYNFAKVPRKLKKKVSKIKGMIIEKSKNDCGETSKEVGREDINLPHEQMNNVKQDSRHRFTKLPRTVMKKVSVVKGMFMEKKENINRELSKEASGSALILPNEQVKKDGPRKPSDRIAKVPRNLKKKVNAFKEMFFKKADNDSGETSH